MFPKKTGVCARKLTCAPGLSLCAERFCDSSSAAIITLHDKKHSLAEVESRTLRSNEKQLDPDIIGKSPNAKGMVTCNIVHWKHVARRQGEVTRESTRSVLLCAPSLGANVILPPGPTPDKSDEDIIALFELQQTYNERPAPRIPIYAPPVSPEASLID
jgi:hypothetical protein